MEKRSEVVTPLAEFYHLEDRQEDAFDILHNTEFLWLPQEQEFEFQRPLLAPNYSTITNQFQDNATVPPAAILDPFVDLDVTEVDATTIMNNNNNMMQGNSNSGQGQSQNENLSQGSNRPRAQRQRSDPNVNESESVGASKKGRQKSPIPSMSSYTAGNNNDTLNNANANQDNNNNDQNLNNNTITIPNIYSNLDDYKLNDSDSDDGFEYEYNEENHTDIVDQKIKIEQVGHNQDEVDLRQELTLANDIQNGNIDFENVEETETTQNQYNPVINVKIENPSVELIERNRSNDNVDVEMQQQQQPEQLELTNYQQDSPQELMVNFDNTSCSFCTLPLKQSEGIMLQTCLHVFCRDCLTTMIIGQPDQCQVKCPFAFELGCDGYLLDREVKSLLTENAYKDYIDRSIRQAEKEMENIFYCKSVGCGNRCEYEIGSNRIFFCSNCSKTNCLECKAIHEGITCEKYQQLYAQCIAHNELDKLEEKINLEVQKTSLGFQQIVKSFQENQAFDQNGNLHSILESMESQELITSNYEFECSICYSDIAKGDGVIISDCLHVFCKICLVNLIKHCEDQKVKCPYAEDTNCTAYLSPREIRGICSSAPEVLDIFNERCMRQTEGIIPNTEHCKTPDCPGYVEIEGDLVDSFICPCCEKKNCLRCKVVHDKMNCEDYRNHLVQDVNNEKSLQEIERLASSNKEYMKCPNCKILIHKFAGCDGMQCKACLHHLCWATKGSRWGPKGPGDTSAGCKCRSKELKGKPCVPNCQNCH